jgi:hypothetical protein
MSVAHRGGRRNRPGHSHRDSAPLFCRTEAWDVRPQRRPEASTSPSRVIALGMDEEGRMLTGLEWERG